MADESHTHGEMDIRTHEKTFEGFIHLVTRATILCIVALIFLALLNA